MFVDGLGVGKHIQAGAKKVIILTPVKGVDIATRVVWLIKKDFPHEVASIISSVFPLIIFVLFKEVGNQWVSEIFIVHIVQNLKAHCFEIAALPLAPLTLGSICESHGLKTW